MLMLDNASVRNIVGSVVDYRVALIVRRVLCASFERDCAPVELAILVIEEFVDASGVHKIVCDPLPIMVLTIEEVNICLCFYAFKKSVD